MALSNIQPNPTRPLAVQARDNTQRSTRKSETARAEDTLNASLLEQVRLGENVLKTDSNRIFIESILARVQQNVVTPAAQELFQAAGKADFEATAYGPNVDISPEATAGRIVDGITGYIYGAWQMQNPEGTEADFAKFQEQVMSGFEKGLQDAKDILSGLQALSPEKEQEIGQTEQIVRDRLAEFFDKTLQQLRDAAQSATRQTTGTTV